MSISGIIKQANYTRFFFDAIGQIIGRIETEENGDAKAFDVYGNLVGMSSSGKTFNQRGEIVAQSDILSSLLVREERIMAKKIAKDYERNLNPPEGKYDLDEIEEIVKSKISDYSIEYLEAKGITWLGDLLLDIHMEDYDNWIGTQIFTQEQIENEEYVGDKWLKKFVGENQDKIEKWLLEDEKFMEWAVEKEVENFEALENDHGYTGTKKNMKSFKIADIINKINKRKNKIAEPVTQDYLSIGTEDLYSEDGPAEKTKTMKYYTPKPKGKFQLGERVDTPYGKGRIIRKQTDYTPYSYTVKITNPEVEDEDIVITEEKEMKKIVGHRISARKPKDIRFSAEARLEIWIDEYDLIDDSEIKKIRSNSSLSMAQKKSLAKERAEEIVKDKLSRLNIEGIEFEYNNLSIDKKMDRMNWEEILTPEDTEEENDDKKGFTLANIKKNEVIAINRPKSTGWIRDLWLAESYKVMELMIEKSPEFENEVENGEGKGLSLYEYYTTSRYELVEKPYRDGSISKGQVKDLLRDLLYEFNTELHTVYGLMPPNKYELSITEPFESEIEKDSYTEIKDNSAALPSSSSMKDISEEIRTKETRAIY